MGSEGQRCSFNGSPTPTGAVLPPLDQMAASRHLFRKLVYLFEVGGVGKGEAEGERAPSRAVLSVEPYAGFDLRTLGSRPEPNLHHPGAPRHLFTEGGKATHQLCGPTLLGWLCWGTANLHRHS